MAWVILRVDGNYRASATQDNMVTNHVTGAALYATEALASVACEGSWEDSIALTLTEAALRELTAIVARRA